MPNRSVLRILCFLVMITLVIAQTDTTDNELTSKKTQLDEKNVDRLELQSDLSIQERELRDIRTEIEQLKQYNKRLEDSLKTKQAQIDSLYDQQHQVENFKLIATTLEEDKTLTEGILKSIQQSEEQPSDTVPTMVEVDDTEYRARYNEALNLYFDRDYQQSIEKFSALLALSKTHPLADNCQYWIGECNYSKEKYLAAIADFQRVKGLGDGNKSDAALFKIGMSYLKMGNQTEAVAAFQRLEKQFPKSDLLGKAQQYLTNQEKF
jgi:TolA-binding protein